MARNIYALLVGIDQYPAPIPTLQGCVNDITAIETYLANRINPEKYQLHIKKLLDQDATRQAIIDGFETHLCQAESDDVVLFYYSGHGSQEIASPEFWDLERDGKLETLVCYDSRTSARDLASKELRCLIAKIAERHPHIVVVLDCCHAGSGTREIDRKQRVRHTAADDRPRKLEEFLPDVALHLQNRGNGADLPEGQHVLLAGCADREVASEYADDGKARGAFSYFLLDALNKASSALSYRELFKEVSSRVRSRIKDQTPRLEANHPDDLDNLPFLGGSEIFKPREPFFTLRHDGSTWTIDGGAIHGLPKKSSIPIKLALYPQSSTSEQMRQLSGNVGEAEVIEVLPDKSIVILTETPSDLTQDTVLKAITVTLPPPTVGVYLEGDLKALAQIRQQLQTVGYGGKPSLYVREVEETTEAQYRLLAKNGQYVITKPFSDRPLVAPLQGYDKAFRAVKNLEHIARWTTTIDLANPESQLPANAIKVQIHRDGKEVKDPHLRLEYEYKNNQWEEPTFQVRLTNTHHQPLFCAILDIAEDYSVSVPPFFPQSEISQTGCVRIEPGQEVWAALYQGNRKISDKISAFFPDKFLEQDITEYQDVFKLIVSTAEFDANLLCQTDLESPQVESGSTTRSLPSQLNSLNLLMAQIQSRQFGAPKLSSIDDWVTSQISITTVRPKNLVKLSSQVPTDLSPGVMIQPHSGLRASARLAAVPPPTRNVNGATLPPILDDYTQPFQFTASRGVAPGLSVLELQVDEGKTIEKVTPKDPLFLSVNQPLNEHEYILPVAQDGDFWLPLGQGSRKDGRTEIRIDRLPVPGEQSSGEKTRSLSGAIRIYFQKVVYHNLGHESPYPKLRVAHIAEDGTVCYIEDGQQIKASVAKARRIVLYIHGIIGDTESMIPSVRHAKVKVNGQLKSLDQIYDLVLTFDYESLNTPIKELGKQLKDKLVAIGLQPNHGKKLHIVAHSMGGLVSRSMIEQWGGDRIVQHLIMLGTPNAGSSWAAVQDMATFALAAGLNGLSSVIFPVKVLGNLVALIEGVDINLDEMHPTKSSFLQELKDCADPGCPYSIIAGNTSLIPQQIEKINRLQAALQRTWQRAIDLPFMQEVHDIAVTVKSIMSVPAGRSPAAYIQDQVACDHLSYFRHPAGLEALAKAVVRAFSDPFNSTTSPQPPQPPIPQSGSSPDNPSVGQPSSRSRSNPSGTSTTQANLQSTDKTTVRSPIQPPINASTDNVKVNCSSQVVRTSAQPTPGQPKPDTGFANSYAVVIGINDYQSGIPPLRTAVNDARKIADLLEKEHEYTLISPPEPINQNKAWMDGNATLANLNDLLKNLKKRIGKNDRLLFYFAGHGIALNSEDGPQGFLIPQDAKHGDTNTYLPMSQLRNALGELPCRHCLIILDCCYSGAFRWSNTRQFGHARQIFKDNFDLFINDPAWQVITSSAHDQTAADEMILKERDFGNAEHSPFASAVMKALKDEGADTYPPAKDGKPAGDGIITADELYQYVRYQIELETAQHNKRQTPGLWIVDEKHDKGVYVFLTKHFNKQNLPDAPTLEDTEESNPYRGLKSYEEEHSQCFFGRTKQIEELCDRVCEHPLTIVLGASGSGKSSLVKAGLIPHLKRSPKEEQQSQILVSLQDNQTHCHKHKQWEILKPIRPGESPVKTLKNILSSIDLGTLPTGTNLLLVIDQFEELVTQCRDQAEREQFLQQLSEQLEKYSGKLHLVLTLRSDFEPQLRESVEAEFKNHQNLELLLNAQQPSQPTGVESKQEPEKRIWDAARFIVPPMTREELQEVIEAPAAVKAIQFDSQTLNNRTLVQQLIHEVADMPGALPLLSFALSELYRKLATRFIDALKKGETGDRTITWIDYNELGGVAQSVTQKANEVYQSLLESNSKEKDAYARTIRNIMLRMISMEGGEIARRKMVEMEWTYADPDENKRANHVINSFVSERLLVKYTIPDVLQPVNTNEVECVEPAHDALVRGWDKLQKWQQEEQEALPLQRRLTPAAIEWKSKEQSPNLLGKAEPVLSWVDKKLDSVENWLNQIKEDSQERQRERKGQFLWNSNPYLDVLKKRLKSYDHWFNQIETEFVQQSIWQKRRNVSGRWITLIMIFAILSWLTITALIGQRNARIQQMLSSSQTSETLLQGRQLTFEALLNSLHAAKSLKQLQGLGIPQLTLQQKNQVISNLRKAVYGVQEVQRLEGFPGTVAKLFWHGNRFLVVTVENQQTVHVWDRENDQSFNISLPEVYVENIQVSPDGSLLAIATVKGSFLWNWQQQRSLFKLPDSVGGNMRFSPDGRMLISDGQNQIQILDVATQQEWNYPHKLPQGTLTNIGFDSQGELLRLVTVDKADSNQRNITIGQIIDSSNQVLYEIELPIGNFDHSVFSPNGEQVVLFQKTIDGYETYEWRFIQKQVESLGETSLVAFSVDGNQQATSGFEDGTVRLRYDRPGLPKDEIEEVKAHSSEIITITFRDDNRQFATAGTDGTIRIWARQPIMPIGTSLSKFEPSVRTLTFHPITNELVIQSTDGNLYWHNGLETRHLRHSPYFFNTMQFSPDGRKLVAIGQDCTLHIMDASGNPLRTDIAQGKIAAFSNLAFSPDSEQLIAVATEPQCGSPQIRGLQKIAVVDLASGHVEMRDVGFGDIRQVIWRLDNRILLAVSGLFDRQHYRESGSDYSFRLWDIVLNRQVTTPSRMFSGDAPINNPSFNQSGNLWATVYGDQTGNGSYVNVTDLDGTRITRFQVQNGRASSIIFSPDGTRLATIIRQDGSLMLEGEGTATIWDIGDLDQLLSIGCDRIRAYMTDFSEDLTPADRHLCDGINPPEIDQLEEQGNISNGDKILVSSLVNPAKQAGVEAIATADFPSAVAYLDTYLQANLNDPEARIYLNNARIADQQSYTIAVSVPIGSDVTSDANGALEVLRGVAQAQELYNKQIRETGSSEPLLKVLIADDRNDPEVAKAIARQLANNPSVLGVIGHFSSNVTRATAGIYNSEGLVTISPVSTSVALLDVLGEYVFRTVPNDAVAAENLANYMIESLNKTRAAVFYNSQSEYSTSLKNAFQSTVTAQNGRVIELDLSSPDFVAKQAIENSIQEDVEVLVLLPNTAVLDKALEVVKMNNRRLPLLAGDDVYGTTILNQGGEQACGLVAAVPWHVLANMDTVFTYFSSRLWRADVNWRSAMAYDATEALLAAIRQVPDGGATRESIAQALQSIDFKANGATGEIQFSRGDRRQSNIQLVEIQPGFRSGYGYDFFPVSSNTIESGELNQPLRCN